VLAKQLGLPRIKGAEGFLAAVLIDSLGSGLFLPFSLLYFTVAVGLPLLTVGLGLSIATIFTLPITPLTGTLVDRFGAKRLVMLAQLLQGIGFLGYLVVNNAFTLVLFALLAGIGQRMFWAAFFTLIADIATPDDRDRWFGLSGAAQNAGTGLGGLIAGLLVASGGVMGYRIIVVANAISFFLAAALLLFYLQESPRQHADKSEGPGYRALLRDRPFLVLVAANIIFALGSSFLSVGIPVYLVTTLRVPAWVVGAVFAFNTALLATAQTLVVRWLEPYRRTRALGLAGLLWGGWCLLSALAFFIPSSLVIPYLFVITCAFTFAELIHYPTSTALATALSPEAVRGRYLAFFQLSWGVALILAPALFTFLFTVHPTLPWLVAAACMLLVSLIMYRLESYLPVQVLRKQQE
jgi:MFS family permease